MKLRRCVIKHALMILCGFILLHFALPFTVFGQNYLLSFNAQAAPEQMDMSTAVFPASLRVLEDEAFSETAIAISVFNDALVHIGDNAFKDNSVLTDVYIPETTLSIGKDAFAADVILHGVEGSYAQTWAESNGLQFLVDDIWHVGSDLAGGFLGKLLMLFCTVVIIDDSKAEYILKRIRAVLRSMRPQDRIELYPINYKFP